MTEQSSDLESLLNRTHAVQDAVTRGDWEQASELELERCNALKQFIQDQKRKHGSLEHLSRQ